jgi:hypothetical protein
VKASRAYIAGLGASGVLIGSFLLLLMVGSAIVAFRGAPGEASNDGLDRLDVTQPGQASRAARSPLRSAERAGRHSARRDDRRDVRRRARDGGSGGAERVSRQQGADAAAGDLVGGAAGAGSTAAGESLVGTGGHSDGGGGLPPLPAQVPQKGVTQAAPTAGGVADDVGGAVERTSGELGETVGEAAPPAEEPGAGAGA